MEKSRISLIFRLALILGSMAIIMAVWTYDVPLPAEFYVSAVTAVICAVLATFAGIQLTKKKGND